MTYIQTFESEELFIRCLNTVKDDEDTYCLEGKEYEVVEEWEDCWVIETEIGLYVLRIEKDNPDFELIVKS